MKTKSININIIWIDIFIFVAGIFIATYARAESALAVDGNAQMNALNTYIDKVIHEDLSTMPDINIPADGEVLAEQSQEKVALVSKLIEGLNVSGERITDVYYLEKRRAGKSIITRAFHKFPDSIPDNTPLSVAVIYQEEWFGPDYRKISSYYREDARIADVENNILNVETIEMTEAFSEDGNIAVIDERHLFIKYKITETGLVLISNDFEYASKDCTKGNSKIIDSYKRATIYDQAGEPMELIIEENNKTILNLVFFGTSKGEVSQKNPDENIMPLIEFARIANTYDQLIKRENAIRLNKSEAGAFPKLSVTMKQVRHLP